MINEKLDEKSNKADNTIQNNKYDESEVKAVIGTLIYLFCGQIFALLFIFILLLIYNFISSLPQSLFIETILTIIALSVALLGLCLSNYTAKKENHDD